MVVVIYVRFLSRFKRCTTLFACLYGEKYEEQQRRMFMASSGMTRHRRTWVRQQRRLGIKALTFWLATRLVPALKLKLRINTTTTLLFLITCNSPLWWPASSIYCI